MRGWVRQTGRHSVRHSKVAGRLKIARGNKGALREEVRIHGDRPGRISRPDTTQYNIKRSGEIQEKSSRSIALYAGSM